MPREIPAEPLARLALASGAAVLAWVAILWSTARLPYLATCLQPHPTLDEALGHCPLCWGAALLALAAALPWPRAARARS